MQSQGTSSGTMSMSPPNCSATAGGVADADVVVGLGSGHRRP
ncbi:MAG: hypothetical protein ACYCS7_09105 [Acidimicrobiales bacterium]